MFKYCCIPVKVLCNFTEQCSSWEASSYLGRQEIPDTFWNVKVHYCIHKSPPLANILGQTILLRVTLLFRSVLMFSSHLMKVQCINFWFSGKMKINYSVHWVILYIHQRKGAPHKKKLSVNRVKWDIKNITTHNFYKTCKRKTPIIFKHYFNIFLLTCVIL